MALHPAPQTKPASQSKPPAARSRLTSLLSLPPLAVLFVVIALAIWSRQERRRSDAKEVLLVGLDRGLLLDDQERAVIGAVSASPLTVVELDSSHSPFLSQPRQLAAILDDARQRLDAR